MIRSGVLGGKKKTSGQKSQANGGDKKRKIANYHTWTTQETMSVLEYLKDSIINNHEIEKPTANIYYQAMIDKQKITGVTINQLKNKVKNLRKDYTAAVEWRKNTGQGVLETDGETSVRDYLLKICPHWDMCDEIFGSKVSIQPPFIFESSQDSTTDNLNEASPASSSSQSNAGVDLVELAQNTEPQAYDDEIDLIENISEKILAQPKGRNKCYTNKTSLSALTDVQLMRVDAIKSKNEIETKKLNFEVKWKNEQQKLDREKITNDNAFRQNQLDQALKIRTMELQQQERIETFRIEQECKLQLELARLRADK